MKPMEIVPSQLTEEEWSRYFECREAIHRCDDPDDPLPSRESRREYMLNPHPDYDISWWVVEDEEKEHIIAMGGIWWTNEKAGNFETSRDTAYCDFALHPNYRTPAAMTMFLRSMVEKAEWLGKNELIIESRGEYQMEYLKSLGGEILSDRSISRMLISDVDWILMEKWKDDGPQRARGVSLEMFSKVPESDLEEYTRLYTETWNQAPLESVAPDLIVTPKSRREMEEYFQSQNEIWTTIISREENGAISGLTEIWYLHEKGFLVEQGLTGVRKEYRGRGLGKWLKAEMLFFIKEHYPEAVVVETGNANTNDAMLSINKRMGFKLHRKELHTKYITLQVRKQLSSS